MSGDGCLRDSMALVLAVLVVAVVMAVVFALVSGGVAVVKSMEAKADQAEAGLVEAHTARDREGNLHREAMFQMWSFAVLALKSEPTPLGNVLVAVASAFVCGWFVVKMFLAWELRQERRGME